MKILLVEDEIKISNALSHFLKRKDIDVDVANDGSEGYIMAKNNIYDVLVLDIMLPGMSGLEILSSLRKEGIKSPILLLTARDSVEDRVKGLNSGADDYLIKPFNTSELFARIKALGRRVQSDILENDLKFGGITLNTTNYSLKMNNITINLPVKEGKLLELLMKRPKQVFSREQILYRIWGYDSDITENNVEIYIHHLRKRLKNKTNVKIHTVRGIGYTLREI